MSKPPSSGPTDEPSAVELTSSALVDDLGSIIELTSSALAEEAPPAAEADPAKDELIGSIISGRYLVGELLGAGGMGAVYRGEQIHLRKKVAIKILRTGLRSLPDLVARFEREAIAGAHVQHPNVVSAIDFGQLEDRSYFLVLEFVEGTPLREVIAKGPLQPLRALRIARQIASALEAVHEKSIVHRDVKPHNIMLDARDQVKLIDFGLAKVRVELLSSATRAAASRPAKALTTAGEVFGTIAYLAPEAARGMDAVDSRADLYALGIVLYQMLTGVHPFEAKDAISLFKRQRFEDAPPIHERAPGVSVPPGVEPIVMRLIQRDPELRYATATEVVAALDAVILAIESGQVAATAAAPVTAAVPVTAAAAASVAGTATAPATVSATAPAAAPGQRKPAARWPWLLIAVAPLATGVTLLVAMRGREPEPPAAVPSASAVQAVSAPPPEPAPPPVAEVEGVDAIGWEVRLRKAASIKDWMDGAKAVVALAKLEPGLLKSEELRRDVVAVAAGIGFEQSNALADQVFDVLTNGLGSEGIDILLEIVRSRGGTRAGRRAHELLERPEVLARAAPATRITFEFRTALCDEKRALLERAVAEGDGRTLFEMQILKDARCSKKRDPCCFRDDEELAGAIQQLKARLGG